MPQRFGRSRAATPGSFAFRRDHRSVPRALGAVVIAWILASLATAASAHGEGSSLEVVPSQVSVGDTVSVFGEVLQPLGQVTVALLTAAGEQPLLVGEVDDVGHFTGSFVVPQLSARIYEVRATDAGGTQVSTFMTVVESGDETEPFALVSPLGLVLVAVLAVATAVALLLTLRTRRMARRRHE